MIHPEPFATAEQVAEFLLLSESAVRKATSSRTNPIPHHRVPGGRSVRYLLSEVRAWVRADGPSPNE